jgi:hypothetical protein
MKSGESAEVPRVVVRLNGEQSASPASRNRSRQLRAEGIAEQPGGSAADVHPLVAPTIEGSAHPRNVH